MGTELHGGGQDLVATTGIGDISERGSVAGLRFVLHDRSGPRDEAAFELREAPADGGRETAFELAPLTAEARALLGADVRPRDDGPGENPPTLDPKAYFRCVPDVSPCDLVPRPDLVNLAVAMKSQPVQNATSRIPAQFTYLGQFIAHDLTRMRRDGTGGSFLNQRSSRLDLDTIFGPPAGGCVPAEDAFEYGGVTAGRTHPCGRIDDLPRSPDDATPGVPCIADRRNDNNLSVAQLTTAFIKFHQVVCYFCDTGDEEKNRDITRRHYQSMVLHDYLKCVVDDRIYNDVYSEAKPDNRRAILPSDRPFPPVFRIPAEFAGACFRFGHSMVRNMYAWNVHRPDETFLNLLRQTHLGSTLKSELNERRLLDEWAINWSMFTTQKSAAIGTAMASQLTELRRRWVDDPPDFGRQYNLAELTLSRGDSLRLPTAAMLRAFMADHLPPDSPELEVLPEDAIIAPDHPWVGVHFDDCARKRLCAATPLWFYVLREAERPGIDGQHLGPMASRIVMETIHAAICATPSNIIREPFEVDERLSCRPARSDRFLFSDFIACVRQHAAIFRGR